MSHAGHTTVCFQGTVSRGTRLYIPLARRAFKSLNLPHTCRNVAGLGAWLRIAHFYPDGLYPVNFYYTSEQEPLPCFHDRLVPLVLGVSRTI